MRTLLVTGLLAQTLLCWKGAIQAKATDETHAGSSSFVVRPAETWKKKYTGGMATSSLEQSLEMEYEGLIKCTDSKGDKIACQDLDNVGGSQCFKFDEGGNIVGSCCTKDGHCGVGTYCYRRSFGCSYWRPGWCEFP